MNNIDLDKTEELLVPEKKKSGVKWILIAIVILVVIALIAVAAYFFLFKKENIKNYKFSDATTNGTTSYFIEMDSVNSITAISNGNTQELYKGNTFIPYILSDSDRVYFVEYDSDFNIIASVNLEGEDYKEIAKISHDDIDYLMDYILVDNKIFYMAESIDNRTYYIYSIDIDSGNKTKIKDIYLNADYGTDSTDLVTDGTKLYYLTSDSLIQIDLDGSNEQTLVSFSEYRNFYKYLFFKNDSLYLEFSDFGDNYVIKQFSLVDGSFETLVNKRDGHYYFGGFEGSNLIYAESIYDDYMDNHNENIDIKINLYDSISQTDRQIAEIDLTPSVTKLQYIGYGVLTDSYQFNDKIYYHFYLHDYENLKYSYIWYTSNLDGSNMEQISYCLD